MKKIAWCFVIIWLCITGTEVFAQQYKMLLLDETSGQPVPFANVLITKNGHWLMADSTGIVFISAEEIRIKSAIVISRVGYRKQQLEALVPDSRMEATVLLKPEVTQLTPATILPEKLDVILSRIRKRLAESLDTPLVANAFYRQYHIENGKPVFMVEADAEVLLPGRKSKLELVNIRHVRRMPSEEQNPDQHSDHLIDLLFMNPVAHPEGTILNKYVGSDVRWRELPVVKEGSLPNLLQLEYERITDHGMFTESGLLKYDSTYHLLEYECTRRLNSGYGPAYDKYKGKYAWLKLEEKISCSYKWVGNLIGITALHQQYTHLLFHSVFHQSDYELTEDFSLQIADVKPGNPANRKDFKLQSNLYEQGVKPDPEFFQESYLRRFGTVDSGFVRLFASPEVLNQKLNTP
ncbi:MAG: hypothetical protein U0Y08_08180 [Bacteroidia bacterium]